MPPSFNDVAKMHTELPRIMTVTDHPKFGVDPWSGFPERGTSPAPMCYENERISALLDPEGIPQLASDFLCMCEYVLANVPALVLVRGTDRQ